jgi:hypothetical protein
MHSPVVVVVGWSGASMGFADRMLHVLATSSFSSSVPEKMHKEQKKFPVELAGGIFSR